METAQKMVLLYELLQKRTLTFEFSPEQEGSFLNFFKEQKNDMMSHLSDRGEVAREIFSGAMNRIGLMCFRAAMILTVLRYFEESKLEKKEESSPEIVLICKEDDFQTALEFAELARNNALAVFERLPTSQNKRIITDTHAELKQKAKDLKKKGNTYAQIAKELLEDENKKGTIYKWCNEQKNTSS